MLGDATIAALREHDAILFGAAGRPDVTPGILERGLIVGMRVAFDLYINERPFQGTAPGHDRPHDFVVIRENTEGPYIGDGGFLRKGTLDEVATQGSVNTRMGVERAIRYAFELARRRDGRRHVTLVHKTNILVYAGDLWERTFDLVAADYPDITTAYNHADAACIYFVQDPHRYDVVVTDNLFGDILTDLGGAVSGGIGLAASANLNPARTGPSMFEPVHGSAPDITGQNKANPTAAVLSAAMMMDFLGEQDIADSAAGGMRVRRHRFDRRRRPSDRDGRGERRLTPRDLAESAAGSTHRDHFVTRRATRSRTITDVTLQAVGRRDEVDEIVAYLGRAQDGRGGQIVELTGEAGIGKSTVVRTIVATAPRRRLAGVVRDPDAAESDFPWTGLAQLLDGVDPRSLDALTRGRARQLKFATSAVRGEAIVPEVVAFGLEALLDNAAEGRSKPLLIAIDDVQWIDTQTAGALAYALRGTPERHSIAVLAQRTGEQSPIEARRLVDPESHAHIQLGGLSLAGLREVLVTAGLGALGRAELARIHQRTRRQSDVRDRAGPHGPARLVV